jgi:hypothetical protein
MAEKSLTTPGKAAVKTHAPLVPILMILSWLGMFIHNTIEFPNFSLLTPENAGPALMSILLFSGWMLLAYRRLFTLLILVWTLTHLIIGAVGSILPLAIWPFVPDQSLRHYMAHSIYAATQLPLIVLLISLLTRKEER